MIIKNRVLLGFILCSGLFISCEPEALPENEQLARKITSGRIGQWRKFDKRTIEEGIGLKSMRFRVKKTSRQFFHKIFP